MLTGNEPYQDVINHLPVRVQAPLEARNARLLLLIHGWTGDENVMWIFTRRLPKNVWIIAPRAPFPADQSGYSWASSKSGINATISEFEPAVEILRAMVDDWHPPGPVDRRTFSIMGFSQGAALAYSFTLYHPERVDRVAGLAGFLPEGASDVISQQPLKGKEIYIAHGTKDERVPIERARLSVQLLKQAGANVAYCEADVGHKLSADCLRGMESFFASTTP